MERGLLDFNQSGRKVEWSLGTFLFCLTDRAKPKDRPPPFSHGKWFDCELARFTRENSVTSNLELAGELGSQRRSQIEVPRVAAFSNKRNHFLRWKLISHPGRPLHCKPRGPASDRLGDCPNGSTRMGFPRPDWSSAPAKIHALIDKSRRNSTWSGLIHCQQPHFLCWCVGARICLLDVGYFQPVCSWPIWFIK